MNDVIISATLKGAFQEISNDGVQFNLVTRGGRTGNSLDEFTVLAYGNSAKFLQQHAKSGDRVVIQGRLSSEKLDSEVYHTAITVNRVLSVAPAQNGIDYTKAVISGLATCEGVRSIKDGESKLASFNIANSRRYVSRDGESRAYTTYLGATLWGERAEELSAKGLIPMTDENITIEGILKPRTYENKDGQTVHKVDIWVDDIVFAQAQSSPEPRRRQEGAETQSETPSTPPQTQPRQARSTQPSASRETSKSLEASPF